VSKVKAIAVENPQRKRRTNATQGQMQPKAHLVCWFVAGVVRIWSEKRGIFSISCRKNIYPYIFCFYANAMRQYG
jgi:hypothetical protein